MKTLPANEQALDDGFAAALIKGGGRVTGLLRNLTVMLTALLFTATAFAGEAKAYAYAVTTHINWLGTPCIAVESTNVANPYVTGVDTVCSPGGGWTFNEVAQPGEYFAANPVMGDAGWISCTTLVDGRIRFSDSATAGDGTDVTCLGIM